VEFSEESRFFPAVQFARSNGTNETEKTALLVEHHRLEWEGQY
jgi:hypothetical protein